HFFTSPTDFSNSLATAQNGSGGGYLGALLLWPLQAIFGKGGTIIAFLAWLLLGISLTLDRAVLELFGWVPLLGEKLQNLWIKLASRRKKHSPDADPSPALQTPQSPGVSRPQQTFHSSPEKPASLEWVLPHIPDILNIGQEIEPDEEYDLHRARIIEETLASFDAPAHIVEINRGPTITQFGVEPDFIEVRSRRRRVRVSKITSLSDDLALALAARRIRMEAPVPGKGYIGIEVPNDQVALVALRDAIQTPSFKEFPSPLKFALGRDVSGNAVTTDLTAMPHLLVAGTTGSGKSVCINSLISCLLLHNTPDELRLIMVDPKRVELSGYEGIPHLLAPVVVDLERVVGVLQWVGREMDQRYHKFSQVGARHIIDYNQKMEQREEMKLPYLVVIIDELADMMMIAPTETERAITRLAQLARATGIHLIISTQRPSTDVVTGLIKANFPARIAFATASGVDSRVILDHPGAETLLGRGDMLFQSPDAPAPVRLQGVFVSDEEIDRLVRYWRFLTAQLRRPKTKTAVGGEPDAPRPNIPLKQMEIWKDMESGKNRDPLWEEAIELVQKENRASISMLQRDLRIGYTRSARLIERMAEENIIGPPKDGPKARDVLD
ncbi:MAG: DNA translocase FtsK, partial [Chloroflexota bacterium]|nr:DNA translocase FtsK [Chloroflexota bacterium]